MFKELKTCVYISDGILNGWVCPNYVVTDEDICDAAKAINPKRQP